MKDFIKIENKNIGFGDCKNCDAHCCKGSFGTIFSQILKDEFINIYKHFPILFIFGSMGFIKPVVLLSNGVNNCPYLKNNLCTIYENRPNVCKIYPLSPNIDNFIYIDKSCPEVFKNISTLNLDNEILKDYQEKYIKTHLEFEKLKIEDFSEVLSIRGIKFYKYVGSKKSIFLDLHKLSLENLKRVV